MTRRTVLGCQWAAGDEPLELLGDRVRAGSLRRRPGRVWLRQPGLHDLPPARGLAGGSRDDLAGGDRHRPDDLQYLRRITAIRGYPVLLARAVTTAGRRLHGLCRHHDRPVRPGHPPRGRDGRRGLLRQLAAVQLAVLSLLAHRARRRRCRLCSGVATNGEQRDYPIPSSIRSYRKNRDARRTTSCRCRAARRITRPLRA